jgi:RHS repeat-associated protein
LLSSDRKQDKTADNKSKDNTNHQTGKPTNGLNVPSISLPKGGGAIKGIGEKFSANAVTGTGSLTVPIFTSPGRSGFGPQLSLSYDSGSGNGPFGFGWSLSLPSVTRKTDKGLPKYQDHDVNDSDIFILSGSEDLVPVLKKIKKEDGKDMLVMDEGRRDGYMVRRYRPRIEGLFARIERWTRADGDVHWRSISKDNILTVYGRDKNSRICDPSDPSGKTRIFSWLICETYDDKGNAMLYEYVAEDGKKIDLSKANERNRLRIANRYVKRIKYGNRRPLLLDITNPSFRKPHTEKPDFSSVNWLFEVVFDYGEGHYNVVPFDESIRKEEQHQYVNASATVLANSCWPSRPDPFSTYRAGYEVRTYRRCHRVLMFHNFPELGSKPYLVRSTEFEYSDFKYSEPVRHATKQELEHEGSTRIASFITAVTQAGYTRKEEGTEPSHDDDSTRNYQTYMDKSLPPLEFKYSRPTINEKVEELDTASLVNLPYGLDGGRYQLVDLDGEGLSGIMTEQAGAWFYKPSLGNGKFGPIQTLPEKPSHADLGSGRQQLLDLAGDGQLDVVTFESPVQGFYERSHDEKWKNFTPFRSLPNIDWKDPNLKFVDLTGDGHADILISKDNVFTWYQSLAEEGFGRAENVRQKLDEEEGPRVVFSDGTQSVYYLADMSGDGLSDLVRIRNGEVCYWPNLGYGRFGAIVTMDNAPWFDSQDQFDQNRIRLADIDGSGVTDIMYLGRQGIQIYFNQSGNSWSNSHLLPSLPTIDNDHFSSIQVADLLGNGTPCLIWSSSLPGNTRRPIHYIDLMKGKKPHLLIKSSNNLGAETHVHYVSSTKFYLEDKHKGRPWMTRLPFPVYVVERIETYDYISRNLFVMRFSYHHGYFDGIEREFRGFGMVEQYDTEEFATLINRETFPALANAEPGFHAPAVHTKTWFHTGTYLGRGHVSDFFAGPLDTYNLGEYYREPGLSDAEKERLLLPDSELPRGLSLQEEREACRALKGAVLRQEVFALDGTPKAEHPYTVTEQNFTIELLQPQGDNLHAVFFTHPRETINYHYERRLVAVLNGKILNDSMVDRTNPSLRWLPDPRVQHTFTLDVDSFGNVLKSAAVGYGRRMDVLGQDLLPEDREKQKLVHITCSENVFTNSVIDKAHAYRAPLPAETCIYELRKAGRDTSGNEPTKLYKFNELLGHINKAGDGNHDINYEDIDFIKAREAATNDAKEANNYFRRLIEHARTLYRPDDLGATQDDLMALLPLGTVQLLALVGESYKLAFTPGLMAKVFHRAGQPLLPNPANVLGGSRGGYVPSQQFKAGGKFPNTDPDDHWWIPTGRVFLSPGSADTAEQELAYARSHFFLPHRYRDPFHSNAVSTENFVSFDAYDLLMFESRDALGNRVTAGERLPGGQIDPGKPGNDYRVLQPRLVTDPNRNRTEAAFDALGMVAGTAVKGKDDRLGDTLNGFLADLTQAQIDGFYDVADPHASALSFLKGATTRIIYDLHRYSRSMGGDREERKQSLPAYAATVSRETHVSDPLPLADLRIHISFSYSDGFGREIQRKMQAEPGPVVEGGPIVNPRWVGSGWIIYNNKGKPVRQYEPFFSQLPEKRHRFEFGVQVGVSPILFYDPLERVVATLHPNHTYEKVVLDSWQQVTYDVNDTIAAHSVQSGDPRTDLDIQGYVAHYFATLPDTWQTWLSLRKDGSLGAQEQAAADKAAAHANTPTTIYFDSLGRPFLTLEHNRFESNGVTRDETYATRIELDIEGNQRTVRDAIDQNGDSQGRIVMRYDYDMLGNCIHQISMDAGARWMLSDAAAKPIRAWDSLGHSLRIEYDELRRPLRSFLAAANTDNPTRELLTERLVYGEQHPEDEQRNLRGKLYIHLDQAGLVSNEAHDFKGNTLHTSRRLAKQYKQVVDWRAVDADHIAVPNSGSAKLDPTALEAAFAPLLESDTFTRRTSYDALNHPVQIVAAHSDQLRAKRNVIQLVYNEANMLERLDVWLDILTDPAGLLDVANVPPSSVGVNNIDYDARGQRLRIDYSNGVSTFYEYDPMTFRLVHLLTRRNVIAFADDCPQSPPTGWPGCHVQNLHYTYDPVGNVTYIRDEAQQTIFFLNKRVEPSTEYTYDAIYRLIKATGREHLGQVGGAPTPHSHNDSLRVGLVHPNDGNAMGSYIEEYVYDAVGNILEMQHLGSDLAKPGWTRHYSYRETSLIEDGTGGNLFKTSNRLSSTTVGNNNPVLEQYVYDAHGNIIRMPHLARAHPISNMHWDYRDQLRQIDVGGGMVYYAYDAAGERVRKVWEKSASLMEEHIYLGDSEIFRLRNGVGAVTLERETLHIMDDKQRIALVETRTLGNDSTQQQIIRYQFTNHLGSASLELGHHAQIISYEEYTPYGSTSYQAVRIRGETPKRYRYTGKERDKESGLSYHGTRYYATWLARWTSCDPANLVEGVNVYSYARGNPSNLIDKSGTQSAPLANTGNPNDPRNYASFEDFSQGAVGPLSEEGLRAAWEQAHPAPQQQHVTQSPTPPQSAGRVIEPPPPVSPPDTTLYVSQGAAYSSYQTAAREVDNPDNPWYVRGTMFVLGVAVTPLALAEEYIARPIANIPYVVHNSGIGIGEHSGRAYLWAQQGEYGEATVEGLHVVKDASTGFVAAASVAAPLASRGASAPVTAATEARATAATGTVWDSVVATQPVYEGTVIPRSFTLASEGGSVWLHGNATEHLAERALANLARGVTPEAVNISTQAQLTSLQAAVSFATRQGVQYGQMIRVSGWELIFQAPRQAGQLPALVHALHR